MLTLEAAKPVPLLLPPPDAAGARSEPTGGRIPSAEDLLDRSIADKLAAERELLSPELKADLGWVFRQISGLDLSKGDCRRFHGTVKVLICAAATTAALVWAIAESGRQLYAPPQRAANPDRGASAPILAARPNRGSDASGRDARLNLLIVADAMTVQQRLAQLGFFLGTANGTWGPQSRQALREFKSANGFPADDAWNRAAEVRLFSPKAVAKIAALVRVGRPAPISVAETYYAPPPGTTLHPLNRSDALRLQKRLANLGFFTAESDGVWGASSRSALRDFKIINGLPADDRWDADTESLLYSQTAVKANGTFIGRWAPDIADCTKAGTAVTRISLLGAEGPGRTCSFGRVLREAAGWSVRAACIGKEGRNIANMKLTVSGNRLSWSSQAGTISYLRCGDARE